MSRLGVKSSVYQGDDSCLGELDVIPVKDQNFQFPNNEIRIHRISPRSQRCRPLSILQTISPSSVCCKLESSSPFQQPNLINLHAICYRKLQTAVVLVGDGEIHLVAMRSKRKKYPCFWCYSVPKGLYNASLGMLNVRCLPIVFDLDETLVAANSMRSFEDKIGVLRDRIASETDPLRLAEMNAQVKRYEDDRLILKQYAESDSVMDDGKVLKVQAEEVPLLSDDHETKLVRPVIRLQEKNIVLTRIFPEIRDTSVLVRLRPAWEVMRSYLTTGGRKRFEVFVCTMAERNYALEMWRLLDPEGLLIGSNQLRDRVVCVKSGSKKSLMNVFQDGICSSRMAMVIDDRLDVWEDKDQPQIHEVPPFTPYYAPEAETANDLHVLHIAKNVVEHVRKCFFEDFDGSLLRKITDVFYEDDVVNLPSSPDTSSYLASTLEKMLLLYSLYHENKFTGQNYIEWKHNLIKVLNGENCTHVLTEPCPKEPAQGATKDMRMSYEKWQRANERAKNYIIASISNVFRTKYQKMASVAEIMGSLEQMFSQGTHSEKEVVPSVLNKRIGVHDHDLNMINYRNDPQGQGAKIDDDAKIHLVLESLQEPFKQLKDFMVNNLNQLINSANKGSINKTKVDPSRPKPKGLRKKKKKIVPKKLSTKKDGKPKGKCFKCGEKGHWKKDCLKLTKSSIGHSLVC